MDTITKRKSFDDEKHDECGSNKKSKIENNKVNIYKFVTETSEGKYVDEFFKYDEYLIKKRSSDIMKIVEEDNTLLVTYNDIIVKYQIVTTNIDDIKNDIKQSEHISHGIKYLETIMSSDNNQYIQEIIIFRDNTSNVLCVYRKDIDVFEMYYATFDHYVQILD